MPEKHPAGQLIAGLGVIETTETDQILRFDGTMVYVETDVFHNGQIVHKKYKRRVSGEVARALLRAIEDKL
jgi:hypothetical protein